MIMHYYSVTGHTENVPVSAPATCTAARWVGAASCEPPRAWWAPPTWPASWWGPACSSSWPPAPTTLARGSRSPCCQTQIGALHFRLFPTLTFLIIMNGKHTFVYSSCQPHYVTPIKRGDILFLALLSVRPSVCPSRFRVRSISGILGSLRFSNNLAQMSSMMKWLVQGQGHSTRLIIVWLYFCLFFIFWTPGGIYN